MRDLGSWFISTVVEGVRFQFLENSTKFEAHLKKKKRRLFLMSHSPAS